MRGHRPSDYSKLVCILYTFLFVFEQVCRSACGPGLFGVTVFSVCLSVEVVDYQHWTLLLFCCPRTAASPPSPLQSESQFWLVYFTVCKSCVFKSVSHSLSRLLLWRMTTAMMRWRETLRHVCLSCPRGCCTQNRSHKSSVHLKRWLSVPIRHTHKAHTVWVMCECEGLMCDLTSSWHCLLQISRSSSWHARYTVLTFLQVMVFYNLFTFLSDAQAVGDVRALVLHLLQDEQLEVCE